VLERAEDGVVARHDLILQRVVDRPGSDDGLLALRDGDRQPRTCSDVGASGPPSTAPSFGPEAMPVRPR
jgi:hypothetical protein